MQDITKIQQEVEHKEELNQDLQLEDKKEETVSKR